MSWSSLNLQPGLWIGALLAGVGTVLLLRWLLRRQRPVVGSASAATAGWMLPALLLCVGIAAIVTSLRLTSAGPASTPAAGDQGSAVREVDFGFVELDHGGRAVSVASYKHGGSMLLRAGEVLHFQAIGDLPLPTLELHLAGKVITLPGANGQIMVETQAGAAVPAVMRAQGDRVSLPGGAPPRVSVKVQVTGPPRVGGP